MRILLLTLLLSLTSLSSLAAKSFPGDAKKQVEAIKSVIEAAYVQGIHSTRDSVAVRAGFHPDFVMHVNSKGKVRKVTLDMWLGRMKMDGKKRPDKIEASFDNVHISGNTASVILRLFKNDKHIYTDYFGLYKFEDGWKIVNKLFYSH